MEKPEASKLALYGVADYCWNTENYDSHRAWRDGIKATINEPAQAAYQLFANHNSDPGANYHRYRREESVEITPQIESFVEAYRESVEPPANFERLMRDFTAIKTATATINKHAGNPESLV